MAQQRAAILDNTAVCAALTQAWEDSQPGVTGGHEEGGFILKIGEREIIATFHTHPNTGSDYLQEPSETDKRAIRDDPDLKGAWYEGEYVISQETIYLITPTGQVGEVGSTRAIFGKA